MKLIEQFVLGKHNDAKLCEDGIFFNEHFACVVDGATSKGQLSHNGQTSGKLAMELIIKTIADFPSSINKIDFFKSINNSIKNYYIKQSDHTLDFFAQNPVERATASVIVYSHYYKEIWCVGNGQCKTGERYYIFDNTIDELLAKIRALYIELSLLTGTPKQEFMDQDKGRAFILPLLKKQTYLQNTHLPTPSAYSVIDGFFFDYDTIMELAIDERSDTIVLASDGYPRIFDTLKETEAYLKEVLIKDPLLYQQYKSTKGLLPDQVSYDDRAFLKIQL